MYVIKTDKGYLKGNITTGGISFVTKAQARHFDRIELLAKFDPIVADLKLMYGCEIVEAEHYGEEVGV